MTEIIIKEKTDEAIAFAADRMHETWREEYRKNNGDKPRWKDMKEASIAFVDARTDIPESALRVDPETGKRQINIAALPNSKLPPQFSGENTAAAKGAIEAILTHPDLDGDTLRFPTIKEGMQKGYRYPAVETMAAIVHEQWLERNGSWAPVEQKKPYSELSEEEKEKDRVVVQEAANALVASGIHYGGKETGYYIDEPKCPAPMANNKKILVGKHTNG